MFDSLINCFVDAIMMNSKQKSCKKRLTNQTHLITLSKNCRRALWHLRLLHASDVDTLLVQGLM